MKSQYHARARWFRGRLLFQIESVIDGHLDIICEIQQGDDAKAKMISNGVPENEAAQIARYIAYYH